MASGPDGDDDELVEIELEELPGEADAPVPPRAPPPGPPLIPAGASPAPRPGAAPPAAPAPSAEVLAPPNEGDVELGDLVEVRQPIVEAAETDAHADRALFEREAEAAVEPVRRAGLLLEVARLVEAEGDRDGALVAARAAFGAAPALAISLWTLRRLLSGAGLWRELADAYATAADAIAAPGAGDARGGRARADLLVERGRLLEDRLQRDANALAAYEAARAVDPDHVGALLALLLAGARRQEPPIVAAALGGLARRAEGPRRAALAIEEARACREQEGGAPRPDGAGRALDVLTAELARADAALPLATVLGELEALTSAETPPDVAVRALGEIAARVAGADPDFAVALWRERARAQLLRLKAPAEALASLDEAARLAPGHPLVAADRLQLAETVTGGAAADALAPALIEQAASDDEAVDLALLHVELALRAGRDEAAAASLASPRVRQQRGARPDLRALELVLAVRARDAGALHEAFVAEADHAADKGAGEARSAADALVAAGAIRQWRLDDAAGAEALYRRALDRVQTHAPATHALVDMLLSAGRGAEAAALLEKTLAWAADVSTMFELWAREKIVSIYADELDQPDKAAPHQRHLVDLTPKDAGRRVRLADIEMSLGGGDVAARVDNLLALAELAGDPAVAIALKVEAGRTLLRAPAAEPRRRGEALLRDLVQQDASGLAASGLEGTLPGASARAELVGEELAAAEADAPAEAVRALRFRLAQHYEEDGRFAEALAALTPLRSEGDQLARAWSYELARRSGEAILEVAILSEETRAADGVLGDEAFVRFAHGEALARAGDPSGAAAAFRRALGAAGTGPGAVDAALALLRIAATNSGGGPAALADALEGLAAACPDDAALAAGAAREAALWRVTAVPAGAPAVAPPPIAPDAAPRDAADTAVLTLLSAAGAGDAAATGGALCDMAALAGQDSAASFSDTDPAWKAELLARAVARARLGGADAAEAVARRAWEMARPPALATSLSDMPLAAGGAWPEGRPDPRRARARRTGGTFGIALDLEVALDAERRGALGSALAIYGSVIGVDPDRLEAWTGIRRVARAGGDLLGEARALARLAAVVRDPGEAAALLEEAAAAYERAGRVDDAITALAKCVELRPNDPKPYMRAYQLLRGDLDAPGRAILFDALLSHRLAAAPLTPAARVALLFERGQHRARRMTDREAGFEDFKEILKIQPEHREALFELARGATEDRDPESAAHWLVQFLGMAADDARAPEARLDLAACYEALRDRAGAVETLRRAAGLRPGDPKPLQRLSDLYLRQGEWKAAIDVLRASEERLPDNADRAALHLRIGAILRDVGRDGPGAAAAFRRAAELDPLGEGTRALVSLHDAAGDARGALVTVDHEVADVRRALAADPLDVRRLERLAELLEMARGHGSTAPIDEAERAVGSVLDLVKGRAAVSAPAGRPQPFAPKTARAFWAELTHPAAGGFAGELWPNLVEAAMELYPAPAAGRGKRTTFPPGSEQRLAWIETTATALGIAGLHIQVAREPGAPAVTALEEPGPVLALGQEAENSLATRFQVGRALGILALRATVLERVGPDELAPVFAAAALLAGVAPPSGLPRPSEELLRTVSRGVSRKQRKALTLQASRFPFEKMDVAAWHEGMLRTAERLGLMLAGDVAASALALAAGGAPHRIAVSPSQVATNPAALDLLRFALGEQYPLLRRAVG